MPQHYTYSIPSLLDKYHVGDPLGRFFDRLMALNRQINLVSRETSRANLDRLAAESLLPLEILGTEFRTYLDIGSGGGFPAVPLMLAIGRLESAVLFERTRKKARALQGLLEDLGLAAQVLDRNFEDHGPVAPAELVTLRLVKLTPRLLDAALQACCPGGKFVCWSAPGFDCTDYSFETVQYALTEDQAVKSLTIFAK